MSGKKRVKAHQPRKPRNWVVVNMIISCKGGPMKDRKGKEKRSSWKNEDWGEDD